MDLYSKAYIYLMDNGYLEFGKIIPACVIESLLDIKFPLSCWENTGKFLKLKETIEENGYFCSQRGAHGNGLRILNIQEWDKKLNNLKTILIRKQKKAINTINQADLSAQEDKVQAKLRHEVDKITMNVQAMKSILYDM